MSKTIDYDAYIEVLKDELIPAMGCTEPIALAYGAAIAKSYLVGAVEEVSIKVSGNILKNVKSVIVPNTGGLYGVEAAVAAGIVAGNKDLKLKVISNVTKNQQKEIKTFLENVPMDLQFCHNETVFDIEIFLKNRAHNSYVRICEFHTNVVEIRRDDWVIAKKKIKSQKTSSRRDHSFLNVEDIIYFADHVAMERIESILESQIECNMAIAQEGLIGDYGARIGKTLIQNYGDNIKVRAKAKAAAASDARMNGCELPVVINSGSGNQGIAASVPVIEYAKELGVSKEVMYRALLVSNLVTIHMKDEIGRLSAYCGAVCAGCGSGAGIAYLYGGRYKEIAHTIVNAVAITSGIICDGAKASCAAKIAMSVEAGILGYYMYTDGNQFQKGDGIVKKGVENTISVVGKLANEGMVETDKEILKLMIRQ